MITNHNGPLRTSQDIGIEVARGRVAGAEPFSAFGRVELAGGGGGQIIWPNGPFIIPPTTGVTLDLVSSSADDADGGTGINEIEVHYLDLDLVQRSERILLNGLVPLAAVLTDVRFVQCVHVSVTGTYGRGAVGEIKLYDALHAYSIIPPGATRCSSSARMVPAGKRLLVTGTVGSSISGTAAARTEIQVVATEFAGHDLTDQGLFIPFASVGLQDGSETFAQPVPLVFSPGAVVAMMAQSDKAAIVSGAWFGWIEDL